MQAFSLTQGRRQDSQARGFRLLNWLFFFWSLLVLFMITVCAEVMYLRQRLPQLPSLKASPRSMDVLISNVVFRNWITLSGALAPETPKVNSSPGWKVGWWVLLMPNFLDDLWHFGWKLEPPHFFITSSKAPNPWKFCSAQVIQLTQPQKAWFSTRKLGHGGGFIPMWRPCDFSWIWVAGTVKESVPAVAADPVVPASADRDVLSEIFVKMCFSCKWTSGYSPWKLEKTTVLRWCSCSGRPRQFCGNLFCCFGGCIL